MKHLSWYQKLIAFVLSCGLCYLWILDFNYQGSNLYTFLFALLWSPAVVVVLVCLLLWNTGHPWMQKILNGVRRFVSVGAVLTFLLAVSSSVSSPGAMRTILPEGVEIFVEILFGLTGALFIPMISILLPLFALDFWRRNYDRALVFALVLSVYVISALFATSYVQEAIASYKDPCYEVVEGKTGTYILKEGLVCVLRSTSAHGTSVFQTLEGADATTFEVVGYEFGKDDLNVYYGSEIMASLDTKSFHALGDSYYADTTYVLYGRAVIVDADPATFVDLPGNYYAKDARRAYYNDVALEGADATSFQAIESNEYAWDKNQVYYAGRRIEGASPKTFHFLKVSSFDGYSYDDDQVFAYDTWLKNLDVKSYERVSDSYYLKDADSLYYLDNEIIGVDAQKFRIAPVYQEAEHENESPFFSKDECGTDESVVVCHGKVVIGANPDTYFQMTEEQKNHMDSFSQWFDEVSQ